MAFLKTLKLLLLGAFGVWFIIFAATNNDAVELTLFPLPYDIVLPKFLFAMACFLGGVFIAAIALGLKHSADTSQNKRLKRRVSALEEEMHAAKIQQDAALPAKTTSS